MGIEGTVLENENEPAERRTGTAEALEAGALLGTPSKIDDRFFSVLVPAGASQVMFDKKQLELQLAAHPHRKTGLFKVQDADSFTGYMAKHATGDSEVYANPATFSLVGVVNSHASTRAGHGDHRVELELLLTDEWKTWLNLDKRWLDQATFAEHLEDNAADVVEPDAATMLEIAQNFHASRSGEFQRAERLSSGQVSLRYKETIAARAGESGALDIPTEFAVSIAPFHSCPRAVVRARFRYRIREGNLALSYALIRPGDVARGVYDSIVEDVKNVVVGSVFSGTHPDY